MYTLQRQCRACGYGEAVTAPGIKSASNNERLIPVFDLGIQPLANDFKKDGEEHSGYAPLQVLFCPNCSLGQLSVNVDPAILYNRYCYVTSTSATMKAHFKLLAKELKNHFTSTATVLEIGSNDGRLLKCLRDEHGFSNVYGIDPAANLVSDANKQGIETVQGLFNEKSAVAWAERYGTADIILARHVFCHIADWKGFIRAVKHVSNRDTLIGIEVPHTKKMLENAEFDTVYHEHLSYLTLKSVVALLRGSGLHIHNVTEYEIHGGTIIIWIRNDDHMGIPEVGVQPMIDSENITIESWKEFGVKSKINIEFLSGKVANLAAEGKTVCGFGASAKSTVWVNACGFNRKQIRFITDTTPWKQWTLSPGSDIPIVDEGALTRELPDYAILFAWNYAKEIIANNQAYLDSGGQFIIPIKT